MGGAPSKDQGKELLRRLALPKIEKDSDADRFTGGLASGKSEEDAKAKLAEWRQLSAGQNNLRNTPDYTDLVVRANRNLKALKGQSALGFDASLAGMVK